MATAVSVADVAVTHPRAVRRHEAGAADFVSRLCGRAITSVRRRGKYLCLELGAYPELDAVPGGDLGEALLTHLGMSGQLRV